MPPKTRASKATKLKDLIDSQVIKPTRKALADKTNSASDDNGSVEVSKTVLKKPTTDEITKLEAPNNHKKRPQRERHLPGRLVENQVLKCLDKENVSVLPVSKTRKKHLPAKHTTESPLKVSQKVSERSCESQPRVKHTPVKANFESPSKISPKQPVTSLVESRPRRVCRLPSRFEDHSISPSKFVPVQPFYASTPKVPSKIINSKEENGGSRKVKKDTKKHSDENNGSETSKETFKCYNIVEKVISKSSAISLNDVIKGRTLRSKKAEFMNTTKSKESPFEFQNHEHIFNKSPVQKKTVTRKTSKGMTAKPVNKNTSFRVLEDKKQGEENANNHDIYEFTYDPNEEPPNKKKKRKKVVRKKPSKPKTIVFKNNYVTNMSKSLAVLKDAVAKRQVENIGKMKHVENIVSHTADKKIVTTNVAVPANVIVPSNVAVPTNSALPTVSETLKASENFMRVQGPTPVREQNTAPVRVQNNSSIRVEDIAADFEPSFDINEPCYSPVNTLGCPEIIVTEPERSAVCERDPLNLRDNLSFFDDPPVASSSMNISVRHPQASPWRADFQSLPIKWHVGSYVKSNMTPAVECSFVNFEDNKKKHVYTNIVPQNNEALPEIIDENQPNLKQTSIISFIKEVVEKNAAAKARGRSATPSRNIFEDPIATGVNKPPNNLSKTPRNVVTPQKRTETNVPRDKTPSRNNSNENSSSHDREKSKENLKRKNDSDPNVIPAKTPCKDKDNTFFGFDVSEDEQENVAPKKADNHKIRALRPRARDVLQEINEQTGPTRAAIPVVTRSKAINSDLPSKLYGEMKLATDAPAFPEKPVQNVVETNIDEVLLQEEPIDEDSQSVHLFEDIELIHHLKPHRKSYGKAKKVTFRQRSHSDMDTQDSDLLRPEPSSSGEEDNLDDLTFEMPIVEEKKKKNKKKMTKKQKLSKKEKAEADAWAAGFNSMCEEVEDFPLVVE